MTIDNVVWAVQRWQPRQPLCRTYHDYMAGRHELRFATRSWRDKYGQTVGEKVLAIRENLCPAAVTAFTDGISVESWGDTGALDIAAEEGLTRLEASVTREAWTTGDAFVLVWPGADGQPSAQFQPAHAIIPHVDPLDPDRLDWAAKIWADADRQKGRVNIYTAAGCERWETRAPIMTDREHDTTVTLPQEAAGWQPCTDEDGDWITHTFGAVPVCWFKRDATTQTEWGTSILDDVIPLQDGLNRSLADLIVLSGDYSNPFWYLLNVAPDAPLNPLLAGQMPHFNPAEPLPGSVDASSRRFQPSRQKIFTHEGPGPFGQLNPPDMTILQRVQDGFALKVARVIGVPAYFFTMTSGDVPSGEALRVLSVRRTGRIAAWQRDAGPVWRGVKQLLGMGDEPVRWADPMPLDPTERMQVALDKKSLGYSLEDIARDLGEPDVEGIVLRASQTATDAARAMMAGDVAFGPLGG